MARPREFDEEEVLEQALELFRARGFDGTTLGELEQATGLGRGSLYGAFGDKRSLFRKALARYRDTAMQQSLAALEQPQAGRAEILALFTHLAQEAVRDAERRGCLATNCSMELAERDPDLAHEAARCFERYERAFAQAVRQAQARGEIAAERDPARLARFLTVVMEGMLVLARAKPDAGWLQDSVAEVAALL
ncbi:MAG: TetR family transcriptional regulator C-terminal domain-containing protein [Geminicoccaceae bacterium]